MSHQSITWSYVVELLSLSSISIINYYTGIIQYNNLSVRELRNRIKQKEYGRLPESTKEKYNKIHIK